MHLKKPAFHFSDKYGSKYISASFFYSVLISHPDTDEVHHANLIHFGGLDDHDDDGTYETINPAQPRPLLGISEFLNGNGVARIQCGYIGTINAISCMLNHIMFDRFEDITIPIGGDLVFFHAKPIPVCNITKDHGVVQQHHLDTDFSISNHPLTHSLKRISTDRIVRSISSFPFYTYWIHMFNNAEKHYGNADEVKAAYNNSRAVFNWLGFQKEGSDGVCTDLTPACTWRSGVMSRSKIFESSLLNSFSYIKGVFYTKVLNYQVHLYDYSSKDSFRYSDVYGAYHLVSSTNLLASRVSLSQVYNGTVNYKDLNVSFNNSMSCLDLLLTIHNNCYNGKLDRLTIRAVTREFIIRFGNFVAAHKQAGMKRPSCNGLLPYGDGQTPLFSTSACHEVVRIMPMSGESYNRYFKHVYSYFAGYLINNSDDLIEHRTVVNNATMRFEVMFHEVLISLAFFSFLVCASMLTYQFAYCEINHPRPIRNLIGFCKRVISRRNTVNKKHPVLCDKHSELCDKCGKHSNVNRPKKELGQKKDI